MQKQKSNKNNIPSSVHEIAKVTVKKNTKNKFPLSPKHPLSLGQKAADKVTAFCGSWTFILSVIGYIIVWVALNLTGWWFQWDPWPFIILNLTLSCLAALQAPVILMSNNRQTEKDRINQRYDYLVDRKTEREVQEILRKLGTIENKLRKIDEKIYPTNRTIR